MFGLLRKVFGPRRAVDLRSKSVAYVLIMKRGLKPSDETAYIQKVLGALVPQALANPEVRIRFLSQTGPVDHNYAIVAALSAFGQDIGNPRKYLTTTEEFSDAERGGGLVLKVFHKKGG